MKNGTELERLLETAEEVPLVGGGRIHVIDWNEVTDQYLEHGYFTIADVTKKLEKSLKSQGLQNKVHYSQVLAWIRRLGKKNEIHVVKKVVKQGEYAGTYYLFETKVDD